MFNMKDNSTRTVLFIGMTGSAAYFDKPSDPVADDKVNINWGLDDGHVVGKKNRRGLQAFPYLD